MQWHPMMKSPSGHRPSDITECEMWVQVQDNEQLNVCQRGKTMAPGNLKTRLSRFERSLLL